MELLGEHYYLIKELSEVEEALSLRDKYLYFSEIVFEDNFFLDDIKGIQCIHFDRCTFKMNFYVSQELPTLVMKDCSFKGIVCLRKEAYFIHLAFKGCSFYREVFFVKVKISELVIIYCRQKYLLYDNFFSFEDYRIGNLNFERNSFLNSISFDLDSINHKIFIIPGYTDSVLKFYKNSPALREESTGFRSSKQFDLSYVLNSKASIVIENAVFDELTLNGINNGGQLVIKNLTITDIRINNFSNYGIIKVSEIRNYHDHYGEMNISNSNLGKLELAGCDFSKFQKVRLQNSTFIDIIPMNIKWCERIKDVFYMRPDEYKKYAEIYRQLKTVMAKNNDRIAELFFEKQEMLMHRYHLRNEKDIFRLNERFILWSNQWSNNFGQSWIQAILWLIILNLVTYNTVFFFLHYVNHISYNFITHVSNYLEFLNPVHSFKSLFELEKINKISSFARLFDNLGRIINSYLIFQFIRAFRKLVR